MAKQRTGFSDFLHRRRLALGNKWKDVLSQAYLSRATLHRIRHTDPYHPIAEVDSLRSLANALQFDSWDELVAAFERQDTQAGLQASSEREASGAPPRRGPQNEDALITLSKALRLTPTELARRLAVPPPSSMSGSSDEPFPGGLRLSEMRQARTVPHFVSGVAANRLVEKLEEEDHESRQSAATEDLRAFTIPVDGDCQEPVWHDGDIVLFSFDAYDREGIIPGKSYYLAFIDGSTTFKRVFLDPQDRDVYLLRCWNGAKYPGERRVPTDEVVRIARAISKQIAPEE